MRDTFSYALLTEIAKVLLLLLLLLSAEYFRQSDDTRSSARSLSSIEQIR